jgi:hypothetical protein
MAVAWHSLQYFLKTTNYLEGNSEPSSSVGRHDPKYFIFSHDESAYLRLDERAERAKTKHDRKLITIMQWTDKQNETTHPKNNHQPTN